MAPKHGQQESFSLLASSRKDSVINKGWMALAHWTGPNSASSEHAPNSAPVRTVCSLWCAGT